VATEKETDCKKVKKEEHRKPMYQKKVERGTISIISVHYSNSLSLSTGGTRTTKLRTRRKILGFEQGPKGVLPLSQTKTTLFSLVVQLGYTSI